MRSVSDHDPVITPVSKNEDAALDRTLRPQSLSDYIGQTSVKENLHILIEAAKKRNEPIDHILIHGGPGLGKTTLAYIIAHEVGGTIKLTSGPAIERAGDLAALLTNLEEGNILFIDEIHRLNHAVEEVLYPAMEDFSLDIVVGKGPGARSLRLDLPRFTLIGATTRPSLLSSPLRDRFGAHYKLNFYTTKEIEDIIRRSADILGCQIDDAALSEIAGRSRATPRIANRLLKRVRDFAEVKSSGHITASIAQEALTMLEIDELGLDTVDHKLLEIMCQRFNGGPVGLGTVCATLGEDVTTIEDMHEPFLLQIGFLARTPRGRVVTPAAYTHLQFTLPDGHQAKLSF